MAAQQRVVLADPSADPWIRRLLAALALPLAAAAAVLLLAPDLLETPASGSRSGPAPALLAALSMGAAASFALASRPRRWTQVRIGLTGALVLGWTLLALAALLVDPLQWQRAALHEQAGVVLGAAALVLLPALLSGLGLAQWRRHGAARPPAARMAAPSRIAFAALALLLGVPALGVLLSPLLPDLLTALLPAVQPALPALPGASAEAALEAPPSRLIAALALSHAAMSAHAAADGDWQRVRPAALGLALAAVAALLALAPVLADAPPAAVALALAAVLLALALALQASRRVAALPRPRCLRWRIAGDVQEVAALLADPQGYPRWWGSVCRELQVMLRGDARGIGRLVRLRARGVGPGELGLRMRLVDERLPQGFSVAVDGDLQGQLDWRLSAHGPWVDVTCQWTAQPTRPLWRAGWFLLEPLMRLQQTWALRRGEAGLRLELARRHARDEAARARLPAGAAPVRGPGAVLRALPELFSAGTAPLRLTHRALIECPLPEVFDFAARIDNDASWRADILAVEQRVDSPHVGLGRELRVTQRLAGQRLRREMRVVAWRTDRHMAVESSDGAYRSSREFELLDGVTCITETEDIVLPWWLRPFSGMVAAAANRNAAAAYGRLAELLEEPGPTEPADSGLRAHPA